MTTKPVIFFLDGEKPLGAACMMLDNARALLSEFAERHPEHMDATLASAWDHVATAHNMLDADRYTELEVP
jgi:hypothetical protein